MLPALARVIIAPLVVIPTRHGAAALLAFRSLAVVADDAVGTKC